MQDSVETITIPIAYLEVFALMFISFLIGYLFAYYYQKARFKKQMSGLEQNLAASARVIRENKSSGKVNVGKGKKEETEKSDFDLNLHKKAFSEQVLEKTTEDDGLYVDYNRIGYASSSDADNLQKIIGIGPYTEEKLNDIGIYTYAQISKFSDKDIEIVTELIRFFPDRIKNDNWVSKAKTLVQQKKSGLIPDEDTRKAAMRRA